MKRHIERINRREFLASSIAATLFPLVRNASTQFREVKTYFVHSSSETQVEKGCTDTGDGIYYDGYGLIVQRDCDGGDTAQREGMYWLGDWFRVNQLRIGKYGNPRRVNFNQVMDLLEDEQKTGRFRRHPGQQRWKDPKETSRDQVLPLIAAMGVNKDYVRLDRFHDRLRQDKYFVNKDSLLFFEEFFKRALDRDLLFDGEADKVLFDNAVNNCRDQAKRNMDDVGDDLNLVVQLLLAAVRRGQKIEAIRARYALERPKNYGVYLSRYRAAYPNDFTASKEKMISRMEDGIKNHGWKPDCTSVLGVFKWYFRVEAGGSPGLVTMYKPILDAYFVAPIPS